MKPAGRGEGPTKRRGQDMLDAYIIDSIRREEALQEEERERIQLEIPMHPEQRPERTERPEMGDPIVIPLYPEDDAEDTAA